MSGDDVPTLLDRVEALEATIARVRRLPEFKAAVVEVRGGVFRDVIFVSDLRAAIEGTDS